MKRKAVSIILACVMVASSLIGCGGSSETTESSDTSSTEETTEATEEAEETTEETSSIEGQTISILWVSTATTDAPQAVIEAAEEALGITVEFEQISSGEDGDNIVKTRLATGEMADLISYNSGAALTALNPSEYFMDVTDEFADLLDASFVEAAGEDGVLYGVPSASGQAAAVIYNMDMYEEYDLEIPTTWDDFLANCEILKEAGETAIVSADADSWTVQVPFLGNNYNVLANEPDFPEEFEAGIAKFATTEAALGGFQKLEDTIPYLNEDHSVTTYEDACEKLINDECAHWIMLTGALGNIYGTYGDEVNKLGCFAIPGDDPDNAGLTVWQPGGLYMNKNSEVSEAALAFMEFYISATALDIYTSVTLPNGPYSVLDYELPEECYTGVKQMQELYFDTGLTAPALEYQTQVKGASCDAICQELVSGQTTALEAAEKYDDDCYKQAVQLGLDWD